MSLFFPSRLKKEATTIEAMIRIYCRNHHGPTKILCPECLSLVQYAHKRLQNCPFQEQKTTCGKCPVHCYKPVMREKIREVMRYSGPRMILHHPFLALLHSLDGFRKAAKRP